MIKTASTLIFLVLLFSGNTSFAQMHAPSVEAEAKVTETAQERERPDTRRADRIAPPLFIAGVALVSVGGSLMTASLITAIAANHPEEEEEIFYGSGGGPGGADQNSLSVNDYGMKQISLLLLVGGAAMTLGGTLGIIYAKRRHRLSNQTVAFTPFASKRGLTVACSVKF